MPARSYWDTGFELIRCHITAAKNWDRVVRGLLTIMSKDPGQARYSLGNGTELINCFLVAAENWERVVRGLLTLKQLRGFWAFLGHFLKEVKQRGLAEDA